MSFGNCSSRKLQNDNYSLNISILFKEYLCDQQTTEALEKFCSKCGEVNLLITSLSSSENLNLFSIISKSSILKLHSFLFEFLQKFLRLRRITKNNICGSTLCVMKCFAFTVGSVLLKTCQFSNCRFKHCSSLFVGFL